MKLSFYQKMSAIGRVFKTIYRDAYHLKLEAEADMLHKFISSSSICFDIGGSYGTFTLVMSRLAKDGCVYSFEPGSYSYKVLSNIVRFHRLKNTIIVKKALSDREEITKICGNHFLIPLFFVANQIVVVRATLVEDRANPATVRELELVGCPFHPEPTAFVRGVGDHGPLMAVLPDRLSDLVPFR